MKETRVLVLGNSHTYFHDLPQVFKKLAKAGGERTEAEMIAYPGVTFGWHLKQEAQLRYTLLYGNWDYVILQQAAHSPCPEPEETLCDGKKLIERVCSVSAVPLLCLPWAERDHPEHQPLMYETYRKLAQEAGVMLTPEGYVFERVRQERPDSDLYHVDGEHCSPYGTYVRALSAYTAIFRKDPRGLPALSLCTVRCTEEEAERFLKLRQRLRQGDPDPQLHEELKEAAAPVYRLCWEKEALPVELDEEKVKTLQRYVYEALRSNITKQ